MLSKLLSMKKADLKAKIQSIDADAVKGRSLRRRFERIRNKEGGFTLLELLVVVLILAAIAGTATIMLQDTDRRGAAGAHVAMMDELSKGIQTFRVLNQNKYPDVWDSLYQNADNTTVGASKLAILSKDLVDTLEFGVALTQKQVDALNNVGIKQVRVLNTAAKVDDVTCGSTADSLKALINDKDNDVTAQTIYRTEGAYGCGFDAAYDDSTTPPTLTTPAHYKLKEGSLVARWGEKANLQRIGVPIGATTTNEDIVAFGVGPDSTLFDPSIIGALSTVPVYRHVEKDEYNRFIVLFNVSSGNAFFQAIIDGAGDTKDEELGEIDNVRNT